MSKQGQTGIRFPFFAQRIHDDADCLPSLIIADGCVPYPLRARSRDGIAAGNAIADWAAMAFAKAFPCIFNKFFIIHENNPHTVKYTVIIIPQGTPFASKTPVSGSSIFASSNRRCIHFPRSRYC